MIDPTKITNYNRTLYELEEFLLFCILVANKRAHYIADKLQLILERLSADKTGFVYDVKNVSPFSLFDGLSMDDIKEVLNDAGIGCYTLKARAIDALVNGPRLGLGVSLIHSTCEELECIPGIGRKTSRYFILHSRKNQNVIPLDTHALHFLRDNGFPWVPKSTPQSRKIYENIERMYISLCPPEMALAAFDLENWNKYAQKLKIS